MNQVKRETTLVESLGEKNSLSDADIICKWYTEQEFNVRIWNPSWCNFKKLNILKLDYLNKIYIIHIHWISDSIRIIMQC